MPSTPLAVRDTVDTDVLRPVVYEALALAAMLPVLGLSTLLPGVDRTVPGLAVTIRELVVATGTVAVVVWLAHSIPAVAALVRSSLVGPDDLVADAGRIAGALVAFLAVLVAYHGLAGVLLPAFGARDAVWAYDLAFLVVGLVPIAVIANRLRCNLDEVTDLATAAIASARDRDRSVETGSSDAT
jgi:hypothetical protein